MILRRYINEAKLASPPILWPPLSAWLLSGQCEPPDIVKTFLQYVICGKSGKDIPSKSERLSSSVAQDLCYAVTNGRMDHA